MPGQLAVVRTSDSCSCPTTALVIVFSLAVCLTTWYVIERTRLGSYLEQRRRTGARQAFGINVPG